MISGCDLVEFIFFKQIINMIAVFTYDQREYDRLELKPEKMFKRIQDMKDIRGRRFTGVMMFENWYHGTPKSTAAMEHIERTQPELFK